MDHPGGLDDVEPFGDLLDEPFDVPPDPTAVRTAGDLRGLVELIIAWEDAQPRREEALAGLVAWYETVYEPAEIADMFAEAREGVNVVVTRAVTFVRPREEVLHQHIGVLPTGFSADTTGVIRQVIAMFRRNALGSHIVVAPAGAPCVRLRLKGGPARGTIDVLRSCLSPRDFAAGPVITSMALGPDAAGLYGRPFTVVPESKLPTLAARARAIAALAASSPVLAAKGFGVAAILYFKMRLIRGITDYKGPSFEGGLRLFLRRDYLVAIATTDGDHTEACLSVARVWLANDVPNLDAALLPFPHHAQHGALLPADCFDAAMLPLNFPPLVVLMPNGLTLLGHASPITEPPHPYVPEAHIDLA
jgi:hypothetical protein